MFTLRHFARSVAVLKGNARLGRRSVVLWCFNPAPCRNRTFRMEQNMLQKARQITGCTSTHAQPFATLETRQVNKLSTQSTAVSFTTEGDFLALSWNNGTKSKFHHIWLRNHCQCNECYNHETHQREADILRVPLDIKPLGVELVEGKEIKIAWPDNHTTVYSVDWLHEHTYRSKQTESHEDDVVLWDSSIALNLPKQVTFEEVMNKEEHLFELSQRIAKYGFAFLEETPCNLEALEKVSNKLGGFVRETHYGRLWDFGTKEQEFADSAYTSQAIRCHTDNTYFTDPSGVQLLHCIEHDGEGGVSLLVDGFNAAEILRQNDPDSFHFLSTNNVPFHYIEEGKYHFRAYGPVIELDPFNGRVVRIRYNPHDLAPLDCYSADDIPRFYNAFKSFSSIIQAQENEFSFKLTPGKLLLAGNWKVLHGRTGFTGSRSMHGCYINRDDFFSKYRIMSEQRNL